MKHYWKSLLLLIVCALAYRFLISWVPAQSGWILTLLWSVILLLFGYFLSPDHKRNSRWLGKTIIALVVVFILGYRLNILSVGEFHQFLTTIGLTGGFLDLLLVYCGWAFFQV